MEKLKTLHTAIESGILTITLNQPEKHNALSIQGMHELRTVIQQVYDRADIKGAIVTGSGADVFSLGADVQELQGLNEINGRKFAEEGQETFILIEHCHKPIVAAINGHAWAGGCELTLACHLRLATARATFAFPQVTRGSIPGFGGTQRLTQFLGKTKAIELLLTGDALTASAAKDLGLINDIMLDREAVMEHSRTLVQKIAANAPLAVGAVINCINAVYSSHENGFQTEANAFANCCKSEDMKIGMAAYLANKTPQFKGI